MSSFMRDINTNGDTDTAADPAAFGESGNGSTEPDASHHNTAAESVAWSTEDDAKLMNAYRKANVMWLQLRGRTPEGEAERRIVTGQGKCSLL